jgi:hypothetical protein
MPFPMSGNSLLHRTQAALASLRLAVVTMLTLGGVCAWATFYEMDHGTEAVQRDIFRTWWFAAILVTLGVNIFSVMMSRYPWKSHHTGFVMAHIGILVLLTGSLISLHYGLDSNLPLYEGETGDRVVLLERSLMVALPDGSSGHFPVVLERDPPAPGRERRFPIPKSDLTLVAEDFHPHVKVNESYVPGAGEKNPALHLRLESSFVKESLWLAARDSARAHQNLGPASFGFHEAKSEADADGLLHHGGSENHVSFVLMPDGGLRYAIQTRSGPGPEGRAAPGDAITTPWMGMQVKVESLVPDGRLERDIVEATPPKKDEQRQPAVKLRVEGPRARSGCCSERRGARVSATSP